MISLFSSEANSVISSPFISRSFVGSAVSKDVMYSVFFMFCVSDMPKPSMLPVTIAVKNKRLNHRTVDFFIVFILIEYEICRILSIFFNICKKKIERIFLKKKALLCAAPCPSGNREHGWEGKMFPVLLLSPYVRKNFSVFFILCKKRLILIYGVISNNAYSSDISRSIVRFALYDFPF